MINQLEAQQVVLAQAQMPGMMGMLMPGATMPASSGIIAYGGPAAGLVLQFNNMSPQDKQNAKVLMITLMGNVVQQSGVCCFVLTIMAGSFCIFPLFLLCCDCFTKTISELRQLPTDAYVAIDTVISQCPNLEKIIINVFDNLLDANKTSILERNIMGLRKLVSFDFVNIGAAVNVRGREYDDFEQYFPQIKQSNRFLYSLAWGKKVVRFTNPPVQMGSSWNNPEISNMNMNLGTNYPPPSAFNVGKPY